MYNGGAQAWGPRASAEMRSRDIGAGRCLGGPRGPGRPSWRASRSIFMAHSEIHITWRLERVSDVYMIKLLGGVDTGLWAPSAPQDDPRSVPRRVRELPRGLQRSSESSGSS